MGKGDKKSRKGKIWIGSYGVRRPKNKKKPYVAQPEVKEITKNVKAEEVIVQQPVVDEKIKKAKKETAPKSIETEAVVPKVKKIPAKKSEPKKESIDADLPTEKPKAKKSTKKS
ncbi:MAG TPA: 30S ribosomal protein THX [Bacteroidales bacterium]|nr:30S ribosomal protein THX [Bacteroidales bacterium]